MLNRALPLCPCCGELMSIISRSVLIGCDVALNSPQEKTASRVGGRSARQSMAPGLILWQSLPASRAYNVSPCVHVSLLTATYSHVIASTFDTKSPAQLANTAGGAYGAHHRWRHQMGSLSAVALLRLLQLRLVTLSIGCILWYLIGLHADVEASILCLRRTEADLKTTRTKILRSLSSLFRKAFPNHFHVGINT